MEIISWDKYFRYTECPQACLWDYVHTQRTTKASHNDTQYLVKGNTVQDLVGKWLLSPDFPWEKDPTKHITDFLESRAREFLLKHWQDDRDRGEPKANVIDLVVDIKMKLYQCLPQLKNHIMLVCGGDRPAEISVEVPVKREAQLWSSGGKPIGKASFEAVIDVQITNHEGMKVIYEGKNTKYPQKVGPHQVWWQADALASGGFEDIADTHYLVFYQTNEFRPVGFLKTTGGRIWTQPDVSNWLENERMRNIEKMIAGDWRAVPSQEICRLCNHRFRCPDKWTKPDALVATKIKGGIQSDVM